MVLKDSPGSMQHRRKDGNKGKLSQSSDSPAHTQEDVCLAPGTVKGLTNGGEGTLDPKSLSVGMK